MTLLLKCYTVNANWLFKEEVIDFHVEYFKRWDASYLKIKDTTTNYSGTYTCIGKHELGHQFAAQSTVTVLSETEP